MTRTSTETVLRLWKSLTGVILSSNKTQQVTWDFEASEWQTKSGSMQMSALEHYKKKNRARTLTGLELGTYSCSHSCKFNHSTSFLLSRYNHIQNIPVLGARKERRKKSQLEEEERCRTFELVFPFTAQSITMKTQSTCRVRNSKHWRK